MSWILGVKYCTYGTAQVQCCTCAHAHAGIIDNLREWHSSCFKDWDWNGSHTLLISDYFSASKCSLSCGIVLGWYHIVLIIKDHYTHLFVQTLVMPLPCQSPSSCPDVSVIKSSLSVCS